MANAPSPESFLTEAAPWAPPGVSEEPLRAIEHRLAIVSAAAALLLCLAFAPWSAPFQQRDSLLFFFLSERAAYGTPPYISAFSPYNALGELLPGLVIAAGRVIGVDAVYATRAVSIVAFVGTVVLVALLSLRLTRNLPASGLAMLACLTFSPLAFMATSGGQPKTLLVFLMMVILVAVQARWFGLAGSFAAACYLTYQPSLLMLPPVLLAAGLSPKPRSALGRCCAGCLGTVLAYLAYFQLYSAVGEWFLQTHKFMFDSRRPAFNLALALRTWPILWIRGYGRFNILPVVFLATLLGLIGAILLRPRVSLPALRRLPGWLVLILTALGTLAYALLDHTGVPDSFMSLPYIAIFSALGCAALVEVLARRLGGRVSVRRGLYAAVAVTFLGMAGSGYRSLRRTVNITLDDQIILAQRVGELLQAGRSVYALGPTHLLAMNHVDNWTIYGNSHSVRRRWGYWQYLHPGEDFIPARNGKLPDVILWSAGIPQGWPGWLEQHYRPTTQPEFQKQGIEVWERAKGDSS